MKIQQKLDDSERNIKHKPKEKFDAKDVQREKSFITMAITTIIISYYSISNNNNNNSFKRVSYTKRSTTTKNKKISFIKIAWIFC